MHGTLRAEDACFRHSLAIGDSGWLPENIPMPLYICQYFLFQQQLLLLLLLR